MRENIPVPKLVQLPRVPGLLDVVDDAPIQTSLDGFNNIWKDTDIQTRHVSDDSAGQHLWSSDSKHLVAKLSACQRGT